MKSIFTAFFSLTMIACPAFAAGDYTSAGAGLPAGLQQPAYNSLSPSEPAAPPDTTVPLSGLVLMPTAYRGKGENAIGLGLDFNASYYIGRVYGRNSYPQSTQSKNYLDRVGLWLLSADTKMQIQTEGKWRPAVASGVQGIFKFRDSQQQTNSFTVKVTGDKTETYANAYLVLSKRPHPKLMLAAGYSDGDMPKIVYQLSEFLSPDVLRLNGMAGPGRLNIPTGALFGGFMWLPAPDSAIGAEFIIPQGGARSPKLINLHLGTLLKLNFEISYLTYDKGWDLLGMFQFRYNYFPSGRKKSQ